MIKDVFGGKAMVAKRVGIFAQGLCINSKTSDSFFFDNDITASAGIAVAFQ